MDKVYQWVATYPARSILVFLSLSIGASMLPTSLLAAMTPWSQSPDWARLVLQFATLLLSVVFGVIPIAKWYEDRVQKIIDDKPIVLTDRLAEGGYEIRNVGNAPAMDVWLVVATGDGAPVALGSVDTHQSRDVASSLTPLLDQPHILIAANRPFSRRPYTVTFNAPASDQTVRHGFDLGAHLSQRLSRDGTITEYLRSERTNLVSGLEKFVAEVTTPKTVATT